MDYAAPYGSPDPDAPYVDKNVPGAVRGSVPPAAAIEHPQREIRAAIVGGNLAPSGANLTQLRQSIAQSASGARWFVAGGTANAITLAPVGTFAAPDAYFDGMEINFVPAANNTGAVTVNVAGIGAVPLNTALDIAMPLNLLVAGIPITARYSVSAGAFLLMPWVGGHAIANPFYFTVIFETWSTLVNTTYSKMIAGGTFMANGGGFSLASGEVTVPSGGGGIYFMGHMTSVSALNLTVVQGRVVSNAGIAVSTGAGHAGDITDQQTTLSRIVSGVAIVDLRDNDRIWLEIYQNRGSNADAGTNSKIFGVKIG